MPAGDQAAICIPEIHALTEHPSKNQWWHTLEAAYAICINSKVPELHFLYRKAAFVHIYLNVIKIADLLLDVSHIRCFTVLQRDSLKRLHVFILS